MMSRLTIAQEDFDDDDKDDNGDDLSCDDNNDRKNEVSQNQES